MRYWDLWMNKQSNDQSTLKRLPLKLHDVNWHPRKRAHWCVQELLFSSILDIQFIAHLCMIINQFYICYPFFKGGCVWVRFAFCPECNRAEEFTHFPFGKNTCFFVIPPNLNRISSTNWHFLLHSSLPPLFLSWFIRLAAYPSRCRVCRPPKAARLVGKEKKISSMVNYQFMTLLFHKIK